MIITIDKQTDFATLMFNTNCETELNRIDSKSYYFKYKSSNGTWVKLNIGDQIEVDEEYNILGWCRKITNN